MGRRYSSRFVLMRLGIRTFSVGGGTSWRLCGIVRSAFSRAMLPGDVG